MKRNCILLVVVFISFVHIALLSKVTKKEHLLEARLSENIVVIGNILRLELTFNSEYRPSDLLAEIGLSKWIYTGTAGDNVGIRHEPMSLYRYESLKRRVARVVKFDIPFDKRDLIRNHVNFVHGIQITFKLRVKYNDDVIYSGRLATHLITHLAHAKWYQRVFKKRGISPERVRSMEAIQEFYKDLSPEKHHYPPNYIVKLKPFYPEKVKLADTELREMDSQGEQESINTFKESSKEISNNPISLNIVVNEHITPESTKSSGISNDSISPPSQGRSEGSTSGKSSSIISEAVEECCRYMNEKDCAGLKFLVNQQCISSYNRFVSATTWPRSFPIF